MTQPFGFASPKAPPLSVAAAAPPLPAHNAPPPDGYAPPSEPAPALSQITPAPPELRDPTEPFGDALPDHNPTADWQPNQPLPTSASPAAQPAPTQVDLATLPPPTGQPVNQPTPYPSPFGVNPYATGPYSAPAPYGPPYAGPPAGYPGQARPPQLTLHQVLLAANPYVLGALAAGMLWQEIAPFTLMAAAIVALVRKAPGRVLAAAGGGLMVLITVAWFFDYLYDSQWLATAQLLNIVCLVGLPLITYQQLRR